MRMKGKMGILKLWGCKKPKMGAGSNDHVHIQIIQNFGELSKLLAHFVI